MAKPLSSRMSNLCEGRVQHHRNRTTLQLNAIGSLWLAVTTMSASPANGPPATGDAWLTGFCLCLVCQGKEMAQRRTSEPNIFIIPQAWIHSHRTWASPPSCLLADYYRVKPQLTLPSPASILQTSNSSRSCVSFAGPA